MVYDDINTHSLRSELSQERWFGGCSADLQDALLVHGRLRRLIDGEALYSREASAEHALFCVLEGAVCVGNTDAQGSPTLLVYLEPYHWFGELPLIDNLPRLHDAVSDGPSLVLSVPHSRLLKWLDHHPVHWRDFAKLSAMKLRVAYQVLGEAGPLLQRFARRLWLLAHGFGSRSDQPRLRLSLSQELMANMLGASRQSINSALQKLEQEGVIRQYYRGIEILDLEALRLMAGLNTPSKLVRERE